MDLTTFAVVPLTVLAINLTVIRQVRVVQLVVTCYSRAENNTAWVQTLRVLPSSQCVHFLAPLFGQFLTCVSILRTLLI